MQADTILHELIDKIDQNPYEPQGYYNLGTFLVTQKNYVQAEELFKRALNVFKDQPKQQQVLYYGLGNVYYESELYEQAIATFQKIQDIKLKGQAYLMLAQSYYAKKNYQQALAFALTASEEQQCFDESLNLVADCFLALGDFNQAQKYYQKILQKDINNVHANFHYGLCLVVLGKDPARYFERVKHQDLAYYQKMQQRLTDIQNLFKHQD